MKILDENIADSQRRQLLARGHHVKQIGYEIGWKSMKDRNDIIPRLHRLRRPTFFTHDADFYDPDLRHTGYCLVYLDVDEDEAAEYIRRVLRHPVFRTKAQRMGKVIRVRSSRLNFWQVGKKVEQAALW